MYKPRYTRIGSFRSMSNVKLLNVKLVLICKVFHKFSSNLFVCLHGPKNRAKLRHLGIKFLRNYHPLFVFVFVFVFVFFLYFQILTVKSGKAYMKCVFGGYTSLHITL